MKLLKINEKKTKTYSICETSLPVSEKVAVSVTISKRISISLTLKFLLYTLSIEATVTGIGLVCTDLSFKK